MKQLEQDGEEDDAELADQVRAMLEYTSQINKYIMFVLSAYTILFV